MPTIHQIDPTTLQQWLAANEAILIDVREPAEYKAYRIAAARNIPLATVSIENISATQRSNKKLVFQCEKGRRSMTACEKLHAGNLPHDVWNLEGGISAWREANLPVVTGNKKVLPLDRQVLLIIGIAIVVGLALGLFISPLWLLLPLAGGLGLINTALTGWCGLRNVLAKMPWNKG